jgi:hypothetical protein
MALIIRLFNGFPGFFQVAALVETVCILRRVYSIVYAHVKTHVSVLCFVRINVIFMRL